MARGKTSDEGELDRASRELPDFRSMIDYGSLSDEDLIALYYGGDNEAFGVLGKRYLPRFISYFLKETGHPTDAQDLAQNALFKIIMSRYDPARASFKTWTFLITRNVCVDFWRERKRHHENLKKRANDNDREESPPLDDPGGESATSYVPSAEHEASAIESARQILECLSTLPEREATALRFLWLGDHKGRRLIKEGDIAQVMGLSFSHFSELKEKALKNLERCLEQRGYVELSKFILARRMKVK